MTEPRSPENQGLNRGGVAEESRKKVPPSYLFTPNRAESSEILTSRVESSEKQRNAEERPGEKSHDQDQRPQTSRENAAGGVNTISSVLTRAEEKAKELLEEVKERTEVIGRSVESTLGLGGEEGEKKPKSPENQGLNRGGVAEESREKAPPSYLFTPNRAESSEILTNRVESSGQQHNAEERPGEKSHDQDQRRQTSRDDAAGGNLLNTISSVLTRAEEKAKGLVEEVKERTEVIGRSVESTLGLGGDECEKKLDELVQKVDSKVNPEKLKEQIQKTEEEAKAKAEQMGEDVYKRAKEYKENVMKWDKDYDPRRDPYTVKFPPERSPDDRAQLSKKEE